MIVNRKMYDVIKIIVNKFNFGCRINHELFSSFNIQINIFTSED